MLGASTCTTSRNLLGAARKFLQAAFERGDEKQILRCAQDDIFGWLSF